mgnify:CR=1 FL=1
MAISKLGSWVSLVTAGTFTLNASTELLVWMGSSEANDLDGSISIVLDSRS